MQAHIRAIITSGDGGSYIAITWSRDEGTHECHWVSCGLTCSWLPCGDLTRSWSSCLDVAKLASISFRQVASHGDLRRGVIFNAMPGYL